MLGWDGDDQCYSKEGPEFLGNDDEFRGPISSRMFDPKEKHEKRIYPGSPRIVDYKPLLK